MQGEIKNLQASRIIFRPLDTKNKKVIRFVYEQGDKANSVIDVFAGGNPKLFAMSIENKSAPQYDQSKKKIDPTRRYTLRGLKRCPSCGELNGQRAALCRNLNCEQRINKLANIRPFDPVQLIDHTGSALYSLRSKERDVQPRNFVQITEITLALEPPNSEIVSRNAVCFVDTCKYDASDATGITCKHIKACTVEPGKPTLPVAEVYTISREVLFNLNISCEQKNSIWELYKEDENGVPAVQRLNSTTFAVKCSQSKIFPAGRLHVNAANGGHANKHACACKKLKIIVEPDNSVVMQDEICEHLLMVLAGVLSHPNGKKDFGNLTNELKYLWMPETLNKPIIDEAQHDPFLSISIGGNLQEDDHFKNDTDDIFIFDDKFISGDVFPDYSDIILELQSNNDSPTDAPPPVDANEISSLTDCYIESSPNELAIGILHQGDPNLMSSCDMNEDCSMDLQDIVNATQGITTLVENIHNSTSLEPTHLELTDCNIELMDQFQLTDQLDICSDEITMPIDATKDTINILSSAPLHLNTVEPLKPIISTESLIQTNHTTTQTSSLPPIELPTITVVKKCPIKVANIVDEVKTRKFPRIPAKRSLIVNNQNAAQNQSIISSVDIVTSTTEPSLSYSAWLEYVIESINESITIDENNVHHTFHVHEEIFAHFSKTFSAGNKFRIPNTTAVIKHGRYKGFIKYTWYFTTATTVRRIFQTKNIAIQLERRFERCNDGTFIPYTPLPIQYPATYKGRRMYPKLALFLAYICFDAGDSGHNTGLKIEWLPNVFPKSHFGTLTVAFSLGVRDPRVLDTNKTA